VTNRHAIIFRIHHPSTEAIQVSVAETAAVGVSRHQSLTSTCATMQAQTDQYLHELRASLPEEDASPFGADGRQPMHCLPHWRKIF